MVIYEKKMQIISHLEAMEKTMFLLLIVLFPRGFFIILNYMDFAPLHTFRLQNMTQLPVLKSPLCLKKSWGEGDAAVVRNKHLQNIYFALRITYEDYRCKKVAKTVHVHVKI